MEDFSHLKNYYLSDSKRWLDQAVLLKKTADLIYGQFLVDIHDREPGWLIVTSRSTSDLENTSPYALLGPYKLLLGLSMENLLKALLVRKHGTFKDEWASGSSGHDIVALIKILKYSVTDPEVESLTELSAYVSWAGRYPAPKKSTDFGSVKLNERALFNTFNVEVIGLVENVFMRLFDEFNQ